MERHCIGDGCFTDVTFELDDGLMKVDNNGIGNVLKITNILYIYI